MTGGIPPEGPRVEHRYVDTDLGQVHVARLAPPASPVLSRPSLTVVLVHQVPSSHLMWRAVMERLAALGSDCLAVDLPGFGFSEQPPAPLSVEEHGRALVAAVRPLVRGSCLLVGHHFGSVVALEAANQEPSLAHAVAGYGIPLLSEERRHALATEAFTRLGPAGDEVAAYWTARRARNGASPDVEHTRRALIEWLLAGDHAVWGHRAVGRYDTASALARLRQPLLGIAGEREDLYEETRRAAGTAPHGRFQSLGAAGIDVADTAVDELCEVLVAFDDTARRAA